MTETEAIASLLAARLAGQTICPSEAARLLAAPDRDWRTYMAPVHAAARQLAAAGEVKLTWRGAARTGADGPYRISRP